MGHKTTTPGHPSVSRCLANFSISLLILLLSLFVGRRGSSKSQFLATSNLHTELPLQFWPLFLPGLAKASQDSATAPPSGHALALQPSQVSSSLEKGFVSLVDSVGQRSVQGALSVPQGRLPEVPSTLKAAVGGS